MGQSGKMQLSPSAILEGVVVSRTMHGALLVIPLGLGQAERIQRVDVELVPGPIG